MLAAPLLISADVDLVSGDRTEPSDSQAHVCIRDTQAAAFALPNGDAHSEPSRFVRGVCFGLVLAAFAWAGIGYGIFRLFS